MVMGDKLHTKNSEKYYANSCFIIIGQKVFPDRQYKKSINNDLQNTAQKTKKRSFCHDLIFLFFFFFKQICHRWMRLKEALKVQIYAEG
jgi:hypothetical protein